MRVIISFSFRALPPLTRTLFRRRPIFDDYCLMMHF
jgi:hypothetical protein